MGAQAVTALYALVPRVLYHDMATYYKTFPMGAHPHIYNLMLTFTTLCHTIPIKYTISFHKMNTAEYELRTNENRLRSELHGCTI